LRWQRDLQGYELRLGDLTSVAPDDRKSLSALVSLSRKTLERSAYTGTLLDTTEPTVMVCPCGGKTRQYDIALGDMPIVLDLLEMPETEEGILAFAKSWGVLSGKTCPLDEFVQTRRQIDRIYRSNWKHRELLAALENKKITSISAEVARRGRGKDLEVLWYARNLREFCWLEVLADLGGTSDIAICSACGRFFGHSSRMGRAPTYCSDACKQVSYRKRQKRQKPKTSGL
jgi:hypothetical protein